MGTSGGARWCVITGEYKRCTHYSKRRCLEIAAAEGGGCVENFELVKAKAKVRQQFGGACKGDVACEIGQSLQAEAESAAASGGEQVQIDLD